jgi:hypothetical protein
VTRAEAAGCRLDVPRPPSGGRVGGSRRPGRIVPANYTSKSKFLKINSILPSETTRRSRVRPRGTGMSGLEPWAGKMSMQSIACNPLHTIQGMAVLWVRKPNWPLFSHPPRTPRRREIPRGAASAVVPGINQRHDFSSRVNFLVGESASRRVGESASRRGAMDVSGERPL